MMDEAKSKRLARAILSDVCLYNAALVKDLAASGRASPQLEAAFEEGRELYRSRSAHHEIFEQQLKMLRLTGELSAD